MGIERITNEEKAREICGCGNCHHNFKGDECLKYTGILCCLKPCLKNTLQAMEWKDNCLSSWLDILNKEIDKLTTGNLSHNKTHIKCLLYEIQEQLKGE